METFRRIVRKHDFWHEVAHWKPFLGMETFADSIGDVLRTLETHGTMETLPYPLHCEECARYAMETSELVAY